MLPICTMCLYRSHPLTVLEMERLLDETMAGDTLTVEYKVHCLSHTTYILIYMCTSELKYESL